MAVTLNKANLVLKDANGNIERFYLTVKGRNYETPSLIINEISVKGTQSNPDRIELYVLNKGDTAGVVVSDEKFSFTLPSIKVKEGDIILIYWDKSTTKKNYERDRGKMTYILNENASDTFAAVVIALKSQGNSGDPL